MLRDVTPVMMLLMLLVTVHVYFLLVVQHMILEVVILPIEIVINFLEAVPQISSVATNVYKITIPKNGGYFKRQAAIGRRNTPHHSTSLYNAHSK